MAIEAMMPTALLLETHATPYTLLAPLPPLPHSSALVGPPSLVLMDTPTPT